MNQQLITAQYLDHMGTDLTVCNAARVSFGKESNWLPSGAPSDYLGVVYQQRFVEGQMRPVNLTKRDAGLIRFLATGYRSSEWEALLDEIIDHARHGNKGKLTDLLRTYKRMAQHWAPFAHPQLQIRIQIPVFLARQFVKHQVGAVWSEESRRYISDEPGVWFPEEWHTRPDDIKQGSGGLVADQNNTRGIAQYATNAALVNYDRLKKKGVAPEEARTILPLNMMTAVVWTGSLLFWSRVCNQRLDSHAQLAAQELAKQIANIAQPLFPVSWAALVGE